MAQAQQGRTTVAVRAAGERAGLQGGGRSPTPPMMGPIELESESVSTLDAPAPVRAVGVELEVVEIATVGSDSTVMPSAAEAAAAVPRLEESEACTLAALEAGTVIVAVIITLAAATVMTVDEGATPAVAAIERRRAVVSE